MFVFGDVPLTASTPQGGHSCLSIHFLSQLQPQIEKLSRSTHFKIIVRVCLEILKDKHFSITVNTTCLVHDKDKLLREIVVNAIIV